MVIYIVVATSYDTHAVTRAFATRRSALRYIRGRSFARTYRHSRFSGGGFFAYIVARKVNP